MAMLSFVKVLLYAYLFTLVSANLFRGGVGSTRIIGGTEVSGNICKPMLHDLPCHHCLFSLMPPFVHSCSPTNLHLVMMTTAWRRQRPILGVSDEFRQPFLWRLSHHRSSRAHSCSLSRRLHQRCDWSSWLWWQGRGGHLRQQANPPSRLWWQY